MSDSENQIDTGATATEFKPAFQIPVNEFGKKVRAKQELWFFVASGMDCYCPEINQCTSYFLGDMVSGAKHGK